MREIFGHSRHKIVDPVGSYLLDARREALDEQGSSLRPDLAG